MGVSGLVTKYILDSRIEDFGINAFCQKVAALLVRESQDRPKTRQSNLKYKRKILELRITKRKTII